MRRSLGSFALLAISLVGSAALAQPRPGAPAPARPGATPPPTSAPITLPPSPEVNDPMLAPIPRPRVEIATWDEALKYVRARSTDLKIAVQQVVRAEAASRIALAGALPTINAQGAVTHNIITNKSLQPARGGGFTSVESPFPDFINGQLSFSQPVLALRAWYNIGTTDHNETVAQLSFHDQQRVIALAVANAIVGVITTERVAELNRVGLLNSLQRLDLATRKATLGSGTGLDVVRARQDIETARATLVDGDESARKAREALGLALGLPEQVGVPPGISLDNLESSAKASCKPARGVDDRADIASLREKAVVSRRMVNDVKLQFMPTVDLKSGVSTTTVDTGAAPNTTWNIQAVLTVPIFDGGIKYGNLRDAHAQEAIAGENLEAARRKAEIEVIQAQRGVKVAEDRRRVAAQARDLAAENDRLTRTAYTEGRGTSLELITAAQGLRTAEITLALRDFELVQARVLAVLSLASCAW